MLILYASYTYIIPSLNRELVHDIMNAIGLEDQYEFFYKEMDGWDIWSIDEEADRGRELAGMSTKWIEKWTINFKVRFLFLCINSVKGSICSGYPRVKITC